MQNQSSGIRDNKCQLGVGRAHTIHPGGGFADAHRAMLLYQLAFQSQHIAGHNLAAETGIFYPAKQGNLSTVSGRLNAATAPVWARASRINTPGITGWPGKCPWKNDSVRVTHLIPRAHWPGV